MSWRDRLTATNAPAAVLLIRLYVGVVFASEGILKFLRPDALGTGRFEKAGIPAPGFFAYLDGVAEITCGVMLLVGLLTRLAAIPMIINMIGALAITKVPILWGNAALFRGKSGWWDFSHEARLDLAQLCGSIFLLIVGAGALSLDKRLPTSVRKMPAAAACRCTDTHARGRCGHCGHQGAAG
ncbi:DoxX family protein [Mycobacterium intermedium]|nr:DoxX family protein [Mycobacterium intermedium]